MRLIMTGTGTPHLNPLRSGPSQAVEVGEDLLLFDCGDGTTMQLVHAGVRPEAIRDLFFTHLHTDHTHGLSQFVIGGWIYGRRELRVYGPRGTDRLVHLLFKEAYEEDLADRIRVGRSPEGVADIGVQRITEEFVLERPAYRVTAAQAAHSLETYAYRIDADGRGLVITGDTTYTERIVHLARGAHTIVHECMFAVSEPPTPAYANVWKHIAEVHSTPEMAGRTAREAGARRVVLTHIPPSAVAEEMKGRCATEFDGEIVVAEDLLQLEW